MRLENIVSEAKSAGYYPCPPSCWQAVEEAAMGPIRRVLAGSRLDPGLASDVCQELLFTLWREGEWRLPESPAQLRSYVGTAARRVALRLVARWRSQRRHEILAARSRPFARDALAGPTESRVIGVTSEMAILMTPRERRRLASLLDATPPPAGHSDRTRRRWAEDLHRRYAWRVI